MQIWVVFHEHVRILVIIIQINYLIHIINLNILLFEIFVFVIGIILLSVILGLDIEIECVVLNLIIVIIFLFIREIRTIAIHVRILLDRADFFLLSGGIVRFVLVGDLESWHDEIGVVSLLCRLLGFLDGRILDLLRRGFLLR